MYRAYRLGAATLAVFLLALLVLGCGPVSNPFEKTASEAKAKSLLKEFQVAQSLFQVEGWQGHGYGSLHQLRQAGAGMSMISDELYRASDAHPDPEPVAGYLFSEIVREPSGAPLDRRRRAGLAAYPAHPGKSGDKVILMLLDLSRASAPPSDYGGGFASRGGEEWAFYTASSEQVTGPVKRWPSTSELRTTWAPEDKLTPAQGLEKARQLKRDYDRKAQEMQQLLGEE